MTRSESKVSFVMTWCMVRLMFVLSVWMPSLLAKPASMFVLFAPESTTMVTRDLLPPSAISSQVRVLTEHFSNGLLFFLSTAFARPSKSSER